MFGSHLKKIKNKESESSNTTKSISEYLLIHLFCLQDFESNNELKTKVIAFLEEVMHDPELLTQERKAAANIIRSCSVLSDSRITIV